MQIWRCWRKKGFKKNSNGTRRGQLQSALIPSRLGVESLTLAQPDVKNELILWHKLNLNQMKQFWTSLIPNTTAPWSLTSELWQGPGAGIGPEWFGYSGFANWNSKPGPSRCLSFIENALCCFCFHIIGQHNLHFMVIQNGMRAGIVYDISVLLLSFFRSGLTNCQATEREVGSVAFKSGRNKRRESTREWEDMGRTTGAERVEGGEKGGKEEIRELRCRQNVSDRRRQRG